ncbi:hypothetical protein AAC387_Pa06g1323 [Persea americana]
MELSIGKVSLQRLFSPSRSCHVVCRTLLAKSFFLTEVAFRNKLLKTAPVEEKAAFCNQSRFQSEKTGISNEDNVVASLTFPLWLVSRKLLRIRVWGKESSRCPSHSISFKKWCWDCLIKPNGLYGRKQNSSRQGADREISFSVEAPAGSFISHLSGVFSYLGLFFKWIQAFVLELVRYVMLSTG